MANNTACWNLRITGNIAFGNRKKEECQQKVDDQ